jgi:flagellar hook-associated protein 1
MVVRTDIKSNANLLTSGTLTLSKQPTDTTKALYTYEAGSGGNSAAIAMSDLSRKSVYFQAAGDLPSISISFSGYSADVIGSVATAALQATDANATRKIAMDGLQVLFQKNAGVNSDEELSKIIELQNNFAASARVISVLQSLFDVLAQSLR